MAGKYESTCGRSRNRAKLMETEMAWQSFTSAPRTGIEITVKDALDRVSVAHWDAKSDTWRCGGVEHGFPIITELDGHPWTHWDFIHCLRIVPDPSGTTKS